MEFDVTLSAIERPRYSLQKITSLKNITDAFNSVVIFEQSKKITHSWPEMFYVWKKQHSHQMGHSPLKTTVGRVIRSLIFE